MPDDKPSRVARWIGPVTTVGVIALIVVLLLPAIQQAREKARRTQSKWNLKQIGLALHNYHDTFTMFPPGGVFNEEGTAFHGWTTFIAPYLDCSPFYNSLNFNIPWDDPQQVEKFITTPHSIFLNPSVQPVKSPDGIPLVHYSANQWMMNRNSSVGLKDIDTGASHTLAVADALGHFATLGYPYNWRDPLIPMNTSPDGFGYNETGMHALLMDGTVRWIAKDMASEIHASFAGPEKLRPTAEQVEKPAGEYRLRVTPWKSNVVFKASNSSLKLIVRTDSTGKAVEARMGYDYDKGSVTRVPYDSALKGLAAYPDLPIFHGGDWFTDEGLKTLSRLQKLETLSLGGKAITDIGAKHLAEISSLRTLTLDQTEITAAGLRELSRLPKLATLTLIEPAFGDDGIQALHHFPELMQLDLSWHFRPVRLTPAVVLDLLNARPDLSLKIRVDGRLYFTKHVRELVEAGRDWDGKLIEKRGADVE